MQLLCGRNCRSFNPLHWITEWKKLYLVFLYPLRKVKSIWPNETEQKNKDSIKMPDGWFEVPLQHLKNQCHQRNDSRRLTPFSRVLADWLDTKVCCTILITFILTWLELSVLISWLLINWIKGQLRRGTGRYRLPASATSKEKTKTKELLCRAFSWCSLCPPEMRKAHQVARFAEGMKID